LAILATTTGPDQGVAQRKQTNGKVNTRAPELFRGVQENERTRAPHIPASAAPAEARQPVSAGVAKIWRSTREKKLERCVMSVEEIKKSAGQIGTLDSCLIEGDSEQKARERKTKRRALVISIALQSLAILALVLVPLLGHTEKISLSTVTPMPPYYHHPVRPVVEHTTVRQPIRTGFYQPTTISHVIVTHDPSINNNPPPPGIIDMGEVNRPGDVTGLIPVEGTGPAQPDDPNRNQKKRLVRGGDVQQAMLIRRVEPSYPPLMRSIRRSGKVEIRAIISVDGTIESLQVISGDPGFHQSALQAVGQWRYRPTILNGQPVEVETIVTVVYTLNQ
jgi:protein TonB